MTCSLDISKHLMKYGLFSTFLLKLEINLLLLDLIINLNLKGSTFSKISTMSVCRREVLE